jgi:hypothetical protein
MAVDYWGETIGDGDLVWVQVKVGTISGNTLTVGFTNPDNSVTNLSVAAGHVVKQEGDQPPKPQV